MSDQTEHTQAVKANIRKRVRSRGMQKAIQAETITRPQGAAKPAERYVAVSEQGLLGRLAVQRGDGTDIEFKQGQYLTNDSAEADLLRKVPGVSVSDLHKQGARQAKRLYSMGIRFGPDGKVLED